MVLKFIIIGIAAVLILANIDKIKSVFDSKDSEDKEAPIVSNSGSLENLQNDKGLQETRIIVEKIASSGGSGQSDLANAILEGKINEIQAQNLALSAQLQRLAREQREKAITKTFPERTSSTSLSGSGFREGSQIKRDSGFKGSFISDIDSFKSNTNFANTLRREQERAAQISSILFGQIQNRNFDLGLPSDATKAQIDEAINRQNQTASSSTTTNQERLKRAESFNKGVQIIKNQNLSLEEEKRQINLLAKDFGFA